MMNKFEIGKIYNGFIILDKYYKNNLIYYKCQCLKCGYITDKYSSNINKRGCGICSNQIVVKGINDLSTTHPYLMKYVVDKEEAYIHSAGSNYKIKVKCEYCNFEKRIAIFNLVKYGISCNHCGDGISYPNKFMTEFLIQCNIDFENEKIFDWSEHKVYDLYISKMNMIVENHGAGHYKENGFCSLGGNSLCDNIKNDNYKKKLAKENGIDKYIIIDCMISDIDYIKKSILKSDLLKYLNITSEQINWRKCAEFASSNLLKTVCEYYNKTNYSASIIGEKYKLTKQTILSYLKTGNKLGWCKYDPYLKMQERGKISGKQRSIEIICLDTGGIYPNARVLKEYFEKQYNIILEENNIRANCRGVIKYHKGYHFAYIKNFKKCDIKCTGIESGTGRNSDVLGNIVCDYKGFECRVGSGFSDEQRSYYYDNPTEIIGKIVTVKYKEETKNKQGGVSLQFPVFQCVRFDKSEPNY